MGKLMMLRNYKTVVLLSFLLKRKSCCRFLYKTSCLKIFFLLFSKKTKEKFRYYKNRIYICCEMKPKSF